MIANGNVIDISPLTVGARELILLTTALGADELYGGQPLSYDLYDTLGTYGQTYFGDTLLAASGEHVVGIDSDDEYTLPVDASDIYLTGRFAGICPIILDEPVDVEGVQTFFVPAIEFRVCDL